jgi:CMP-N-acetylneuraminic acid synthetase
MYKNKKILGIIPARGGSKGISNKNIIAINGKPLIAYTIEEALKSNYLDRVIVSTDDEKIKDVSLEYGAGVPFVRPDYLSNDTAKTIDVVLHALDFLKKNGERYDYVVLLQPTSPLRKSGDIDDAIDKVMGNNSESLISVCEVEQNPVIMRTINNNRLCEVISFNGDNLRRQNLPAFYIFNGAIYVNSVKMLYNERTFVNDDTLPYIMEKNRSVDIDEPVDILIVESILKGEV